METEFSYGKFHFVLHRQEASVVEMGILALVLAVASLVVEQYAGCS